MADKRYMHFRTYEGHPDTAYLELQDHPHAVSPGIVKKTVYLHQLVENYYGPSLILDLDEHNRAIGIEILYPTQFEDEEELDADE